MPEFAYINRILHMPGVLTMSKFGIWQSPEYDRVLDMSALHCVLNMPEYAWTEF